MPTGPQGQKRPRDSNACAVHVARIATGEIEEDPVQLPPAPQGARRDRRRRGSGRQAHPGTALRDRPQGR